MMGMMGIHLPRKYDSYSLPRFKRKTTSTSKSTILTKIGHHIKLYMCIHICKDSVILKTLNVQQRIYIYYYTHFFDFTDLDIK